mgnify:FL=1
MSNVQVVWKLLEEFHALFKVELDETCRELFEDGDGDARDEVRAIHEVAIPDETRFRQRKRLRKECHIPVEEVVLWEQVQALEVVE